MEFSEIDRAKLLIAMSEALDVPTHPATQEEHARAAFCELISGYDISGYDPVTVMHGLLVCEELEQHLEATGTLYTTIMPRQVQDAYCVGSDAATGGCAC